MKQLDFDLLIRAGRVVCPATGFDGPGVVATRGDRIVDVGENISASATRTFTFPDGILLPGLIDLHAHPACTGSKYGIDPDVELLKRAVTTVLSQGDAGANNWFQYQNTTIERSKTRVRLALNLSAIGESTQAGCFEDLTHVDVDACIRTVEQGGPLIWGIAINTGRLSCGNTDPQEVLQRGLQVAEATDRPILYGMREPADWPFEDQLPNLRSGDVVTYCYRPQPNCIVVDGKVHPAIREARERGVLFDVGHGMASFDFDVAEAAIADGFPPDTISTDKYVQHVDRLPIHDLPHTMSKLKAAGMEEQAILSATTSRPAEVLGFHGELGTLAAGACADMAILRWDAEPRELFDTSGQTRLGGSWKPMMTVRGGVPVDLC